MLIKNKLNTSLVSQFSTEKNKQKNKQKNNEKKYRFNCFIRDLLY